MFRRNSLSAAILLALSCPVLAQNQTQETELDPVVVTANRVARTADETLSSVTVITRKEIEEQQGKSLPDLLRSQPGIQISNTGGPGKTTSLYLRGTNDSHTLVLIDGVRIGSATSGSASLQDIPLSQIERIEIVRGPRASLYGSDAIGGVIQIFTRKGVQSPSFMISGGSRGTIESSVAGGLATDSAWVNFGSSGYATRGINAEPDGTEGDRDGYTRSSVNMRGGARLNEQLDFDLQAMHTEGHNKYDGDPNSTDLKQDLFAGNLRYAANDNYTTRMKLAQTLDASTNFTEEKFYSRYDTRRSQATWQNDWTLAKGQQIIGGVDYLYDEVISSVDYARKNRTNKAIFAQYIGDFGPVDLQLSARHDRNEQFGSHDTSSVAAGYTFTPALRVYASHGTAFKAPTFNDLYWPGSESVDLQPEKSRNSEIGLSGKAGEFSWHANAFHNSIRNMIAWASSPTESDPYRWLPSNVSKARINGLELSANYRLGNTRFAANASMLDPRDRSGGSTDGKLLVRRSRHTANFDVDHTLGAWTFGGSLAETGRRYDNAANTTKLGGYATLGLRTEYAISASWRIQARLENVLDKRYVTASGYAQEGFGAFLTLRYSPK